MVTMKPNPRPTISLALAAGLALAASAHGGTIEGRVRPPFPVADLSTYVIWVEDIEGTFPAPEKPAVMDQKDLKFVPHVLAIPMGATVEFPNSDPVSHNVFSISDAKRFNLGLYKRGAVRRVKFNAAGVVELLCNVHLEMSAYIVVVKNPYFAQTKQDGSFRLENVPAGRHRLRCWHEHGCTWEQVVEVPADGTVEISIETGLRNQESHRRPQPRALLRRTS